MSTAKKIDSNYQMVLVEKLRSGELSYEDAAIYTVLLDMVNANGIEEVFSTLHSLSSDLNERENLESIIINATNWKWSKK